MLAHWCFDKSLPELCVYNTHTPMYLHSVPDLVLLGMCPENLLVLHAQYSCILGCTKINSMFYPKLRWRSLIFTFQVSVKDNLMACNGH